MSATVNVRLCSKHGLSGDVPVVIGPRRSGAVPVRHVPRLVLGPRGLPMVHVPRERAKGGGSRMDSDSAWVRIRHHGAGLKGS